MHNSKTHLPRPQRLSEGLEYRDLVGVMKPTLHVDEFASKMGDDDDIVTLAFTIKGEQAGKDLSDWLERGYDYILDATVSKGEISPGRYLVFAEMERRTTVPQKIVELISDLETLTDIPCKEWTVIILLSLGNHFSNASTSGSLQDVCPPTIAPYLEAGPYCETIFPIDSARISNVPKRAEKRAGGVKKWIPLRENSPEKQ